MYDWTVTLRNLSCLLHLQSFTIKDYKGGYAELDIASSVLGHAPSLNKLILETNVSTDLIFSGDKAKLAEVVPASANVSVRCMCEDNRLNMSLYFTCTALSFYLYTITRYPTRLQ
jgi:hypothetical protein